MTFQNPLNGYAIINVEIVEGERAKESVTVTLNHTKLYEGVTMRFSGVWVKHPKFGYQLKAESCFEIPPATKNAVERYLSSGFFPGIGPVTAKKIVNHFDDDTLDVFRNNIERLSEVKGMAKKKIKVLKESWKENQEMNNIMLFLQEHMISTVFAVKIYKTYGIESITVIKNNPYKLSTDIHGVGFAMADKLAMSLGISEDSKKRITAAIHHVLSNNQADGHCYLTSRQIKGRVKKLLSLDVSEQIEEILNKEELERKIVSLDFTKDNGRSEKRYYARDVYYDEKYVAEKSVRLAKKNYVSDKKSLEVKLQKMIDDSEIKLSSEQFNSVIGVLSKGMSILTGGPGVGKCLKKGTEVLMYDGKKKNVEDIIEGDLLMGDDSTPRKVLSLARGKEKMYDVISNDGKVWGCNESHILSLIYNSKERDIRINGKKYSKGDVVDVSVKDYLKISKRNRVRLMQYSAKIDYKDKFVKFDPYMLGVWLGDGHSNSKTFIVTNLDKEIREHFENWSKENGYKFRFRVNKNRAPSLIISEGEISICSLLKDINVFNNKHIPSNYLINSEHKRLQLLAGLIDSDGYAGKTNCYEIVQKNKKLSKDIFELSSSLGFKTKINEKIAKLNREDGTVYSCKVYKILISGDVERIPIKIERKKIKTNPNKNHLHSGFKLIDKGLGEYYGFEIDGNKRFVLGNYVVTHNTTTVKFVYDMLNSLGKNVLLAAPTGRASQRMTEVIGEQSKTIHRLLKWDGAKSEFRKGELDPLECDFVIIDECSMLDIKLASSLLRAISPETQILLVGDKDQLPSVGPGNVFKDLIESGCVNTYSLEKVFRQAEKSKIISYAHQINKGYTPKIETPMANPKLWNDGTDCMFIDSSMSQDKKDVEWSSLRYGLNAVDMIVKLYTEIIPKYLGKENEIQVLSPMNKGSVGTKEINIRIQNIVNPHKKERPELNVGDRVFREGDRVMQTSNNYDLNVFNGDIGIIKNINGTDRKCIVNFGDKDSSRVVQYERQHLIELELAYSVTCHKSQGSEFETVIIPIINQHYIMLYRNLIYTAITRGKSMVVLVGERDAFKRAIQNVNPNIRQTSLVRFLKENYERIETELEFLD